MLYILLFAVLTLAFCAFICLPSSFLSKHKEYINVIFVITICASYFYMVIYTYFDGGIHDWNFQNTLPTANVSPFMFCLSGLILFMPKRIKNNLYTLVSLLSFAMLVVGLVGALSYAMREFNFYMHVALDCTAHVLISLWGVHLVKSGQVELTTKKAFRGGIIIVCVATVMLVLNLIYDTSFFGLSLYGKHNIYNIIVTGDSILSAIIYFIGLCMVLRVGYHYQRILKEKKKK